MHLTTKKQLLLFFTYLKDLTGQYLRKIYCQCFLTLLLKSHSKRTLKIFRCVETTPDSLIIFIFQHVLKIVTVVEYSSYLFLS